MKKVEPCSCHQQLSKPEHVAGILQLVAMAGDLKPILSIKDQVRQLPHEHSARFDLFFDPGKRVAYLARFARLVASAFPLLAFVVALADIPKARRKVRSQEKGIRTRVG